MRLALEFALTFGPLGVILALLVARRFPGERRIVARRLRAAGMRLRPDRVRWGRPEAAAWAASVFERAPACLRGPPVHA